MHNINYHVSEAGLYDQNPVEGAMGELRRRLYRVMVRRRVPRELWDYSTFRKKRRKHMAHTFWYHWHALDQDSS